MCPTTAEPSVTFSVDRQRASSARSVRFPFRVANGSTRTSRFDYAVDIDERLRGASFDVRGPISLPPGGSGSGFLEVQLPKALVRPGEYTLGLTLDGSRAIPPSTRCVLVVEANRCVWVPAPELALNPDGSINATLRVVNCGNVDLSLSVDLRHRGGWQFEASPPTLTVEAADGSVEVDIVFRTPAGRSPGPADDVTLELSTDGQAVFSRSLRLVSSAGRPARRSGGMWGRAVMPVVAALVGVLLLSGLGLTTVGRDGRSSPPTSRLGASAPTTSVPTTSSPGIGPARPVAPPPVGAAPPQGEPGVVLPPPSEATRPGPSSPAPPGRVPAVAPPPGYQLGVNPTSLDFKYIPFDKQSAPLSATVENTGVTEVAIVKEAIDGPQARDFQLKGGCQGRVLTPGDECEVVVYAYPRFGSPDGNLSATLTVTPDAGPALVVALVGKTMPTPQ